MITITRSPARYSPVKNELVYVMSGGSSTNFGHMYLLDIYSANTDTFIKRMEIPHVPDTVFGVADIQKILSDYIRPEIDIYSGGTNHFPAPNSYLNYYVMVGEQYEKWRYDDYYFNGGRVMFSSATQMHGLIVGDVILVSQDTPYTFQEYQGIQTVYAVVDDYAIVIDEPFQSGPSEAGNIGKYDGEPLRFSGITTGSTRTAFNTAIEYDDWVTYDPTDYVINFPPATKLMSTNAPMDDWYMRLSGQMFLYMPQFSTTVAFPIDELYLSTYTEGGSLVGEYIVSATTGGLTRNPFYFGIGPKDLTNAVDYVVTSGPSEIMNDDVGYYDIYPAKFSPTPPYTEPIRIWLDRTCTKHEVFDILFMDKKGTLNTFSFYLRNDRKLNIKKDQFQKSKGNLVNGVWTVKRSDRGLTTYNVDSTREYVIRTELMNENCSHYLEQLLESPYVYRIVGDYFIPLIVKDGTYTIYNERDKIFLYEMTIAYANYRINLL